MNLLIPCCMFCHYTFSSLFPFSHLWHYSVWIFPGENITKDSKTISDLIAVSCGAYALLVKTFAFTLSPVSPVVPFQTMKLINAFFKFTIFLIKKYLSIHVIKIWQNFTFWRLSKALSEGTLIVSWQTTFFLFFPLVSVVMFILLSWFKIFTQVLTPFFINVVFVTSTGIVELKKILNYFSFV